MRVAIVMPERAQLPADKDVKAFKKNIDNLRRKWVTFFRSTVRSFIISVESRSYESSGIDQAINGNDGPIAWNIQEIVSFLNLPSRR